MNAKLFRENAETRENDLSYSVVGPGHMRAYFTLIPIAGYAAVTNLDKHPHFAPPFKVYSMAGFEAGPRYKTAQAAKRAVRALIVNWLSVAPEEVTWEKEHTGVHWTATVRGIQVANYYYCPKAVGHWHEGFRVWFGGTYYVTPFKGPDEARAAVANSYSKWLSHARTCLLLSQKCHKNGGVK